MTTTEPVIECPKCNHEMRRLKVDDCFVDRCTGCFGIWLDDGERVKLIAHKKITNVLDVGGENLGEKFDEITEIKCPRCKKTMDHKQHPDQSQIGFEECRDCKGSFFDAGELRDLASISIGDVLRMLIGR